MALLPIDNRCGPDPGRPRADDATALAAGRTSPSRPGLQMQPGPLFLCRFLCFHLFNSREGETEMTMHLKTAKPRNPFVAAALRRAAGAHRPGAGARRQQARQALRREIDRLRDSP